MKTETKMLRIATTAAEMEPALKFGPLLIKVVVVRCELVQVIVTPLPPSTAQLALPMGEEMRTEVQAASV